MMERSPDFLVQKHVFWTFQEIVKNNFLRFQTFISGIFFFTGRFCFEISKMIDIFTHAIFRFWMYKPVYSMSETILENYSLIAKISLLNITYRYFDEQKIGKKYRNRTFQNNSVR